MSYKNCFVPVGEASDMQNILFHLISSVQTNVQHYYGLYSPVKGVQTYLSVAVCPEHMTPFSISANPEPTNTTSAKAGRRRDLVP